MDTPSVIKFLEDLNLNQILDLVMKIPNGVQSLKNESDGLSGESSIVLMDGLHDLVSNEAAMMKQLKNKKRKTRKADANHLALPVLLGHSLL